MRTMTAYFAGVGTVAVAIAAGLGGGLLFANIVAPHEPKYATEPSRLEQRMATRAIPVTSAPSEPVPYLAATAPAATIPAATPQPQTEASNATLPAEPKAANDTAAAAPATSTPAPAATREPAASPEDANARGRDADIKRAAEKRRAERRQRWADKRRYRQPRQQELEAVERAVREDAEPRQAFASEPVKFDVPRIRLFGDD